MSRILIATALALVALAVAGPSAASLPDVVDAIQSAREAGRIDPGLAALYRLYEIKAPEKLPADLMAVSRKALAFAEGPGDRCATLPLLEVRSGMASMDPDTLALARELVPETPPPATAARTSALGGAKLVTHFLTFRIETENFSFEWGSDLTNEDGTTPPNDIDENGVPDVVELWASYFEYAYGRIKDLGYTDVPALDEYKISILISNSDPTTSVDNLSNSYYGLTNGLIPHTPGTAPAYIIVNNNIGQIVSNSSNDAPNPVHGAMMVTAAHELHHVFQFLYAPNSWSSNTTMNSINWYLEATSTWIEDEIYPFVNDYKQYFRQQFTGWQLFPEITVAIDWNRTFNQSVKISRTYGSSIFNKYLTEHVGGPSTVSEVWNGLKVGVSFNEAVGQAANIAAGATGLTMDDVFLGFAAANVTMDYDDGKLYGFTPTRNRPQSTSTPLPEILGSTLVDNGAQTVAPKTLTLGSLVPANRWGTAAVATVNDTDLGYSLVLASKGTFQSFVTPDSSNLTTLAAYLGPDLTTSSVSLNLASGAVSDAAAPSQVQWSGVNPLVPANSGFTAAWQQATDETKLGGYVILYRQNGQTRWTGRTILTPLRQASVRELNPDTPYEVRIFAFDATGNIGLPSTPLTVTAGPASPMPPAYVFNLSSPPKLNAIGPKSAVEGQNLTFTVSAADSDTPDPSLVYGALQLPSGATFNAATHTFSWTPGVTQSGSWAVAFTVYDGSTTVWEKVIITVADSNPPTSSSSGSGGGCFLEALGKRQ